MDTVPVQGKLTIFLNIIQAKRFLDISIMYQTLGAPQSDTDGCTRGLNRKTAMDMWKDKAATAEYPFNINSCGCMGFSTSAKRE